MKSYKRKLVLLSFGIMLGVTYKAFAQDAPKTTAPAATDAMGAGTEAAKPAAAAAPAAAAPVAAKPAAPAAAPVAASPASSKPVATAIPEMPEPAAAPAAAKPQASAIPVVAGKRRLSLEQGTAEVINIDKGVSNIFVSNPDVCEVVVYSPGVAYIYGKKPGVATVFAGSKQGATSLNMDVHVTFNVTSLKRAIQGSYPNENISIISTPTGMILEGTVTTPQESRDIVNMAQRYIGEKDQILNNMTITTPTQVYIQVKVAEVRRTVLHQLDINWGMRANIGSMTFGLLQGRDAFNPILAGLDGRNTGLIPFVKNPAANTLNLIGANVVHKNDLTVTNVLDALNQEGLGTILAEPNLMAMSGETAKVLVGGEFPFPVPQGNGAITIQFKQFGISLDFTPTILSGNLISLHVRPEVSNLDKANGIKISLGDTQSADVPALTTRRAETVVEMGSGQSLAIAGLFANTLANNLSEFPGLANVPVLGALFRSAQFQRNETELVIIVTPYLVSPVRDHSLKLPTDHLKHASLMGMILGGRLNRPDSSLKSDDTFVGTSVLDGPAEIQNASLTGFETNLASGDIPAVPTNDQARSSDRAITRPQDLSTGTDVNMAGDAGFYHE